MSHELRRSRIKPKGIIISLISIYNKDSFELKIEINDQIIGVIIKSILISTFVHNNLTSNSIKIDNSKNGIDDMRK